MTVSFSLNPSRFEHSAALAEAAPRPSNTTSVAMRRVSTNPGLLFELTLPAEWEDICWRNARFFMIFLSQAAPLAQAIFLLTAIREDSEFRDRKHVANSRRIVRIQTFSFIFAGNLLRRPVPRQPQDESAKARNRDVSNAGEGRIPAILLKARAQFSEGCFREEEISYSKKMGGKAFAFLPQVNCFEELADRSAGSGCR
jgi:hypothetical protein